MGEMMSFLRLRKHFIIKIRIFLYWLSNWDEEICFFIKNTNQLMTKRLKNLSGISMSYSQKFSRYVMTLPS